MYPFHEFKTGRNLRMSPIYPKLREAGAVFGQVMGYERPAWFDPGYTSGRYSSAEYQVHSKCTLMLSLLLMYVF
jgi:pyruvate dehydrogenase phosphatase regulatory subunit